MKSAIVRSINASMYAISPYLISLVTFSLLYQYGDGLSLSVVFLTLSLFFSIRFSIVYIFPLGIQQVMECRVACKRIKVVYLL